MIAAAFKSLQQNDSDGDATPNTNPKTSSDIKKSSDIDERIAAASNVPGLLSVAENNPGLTRKQSLKVSNLLWQQQAPSKMQF